jgi:hypothetical protein
MSFKKQLIEELRNDPKFRVELSSVLAKELTDMINIKTETHSVSIDFQESDKDLIENIEISFKPKKSTQIPYDFHLDKL